MLPLVPSVGEYRFSTTINEVDYVVNVRWNAEGEVWILDFYDEDEQPIALSVPILLGTHLGRHHSHALFKDGAFVARDLGDGGNTEATYDDLGTRVIVVYY